MNDRLVTISHKKRRTFTGIPFLHGQEIDPKFRANLTKDELAQITTHHCDCMAVAWEMERILIDLMFGAVFNPKRAADILEQWRSVIYDKKQEKEL